ncbi:unnamed protein product [Nippostrongylus brasiliensis]|uniref:Aquaporin-3 n=1 Tax=Nippostrongylus brasiliensis TaxID=27835 RepID=A0A0N4Y308_NIPBR|nr:unnamed protein product [Nippostrongylus brasiliensis]
MIRKFKTSSISERRVYLQPLASAFPCRLRLIGNCVVAQSVLPRPRLNEMIGVNVGFGLAIAFGVAISAKISGGHINPAVSLMFLSFRQLAPIRFVLYTLVQTAGAFVGSALAYAMYHEAINSFDGGVRAVVGPKGTAGIFASYPANHLGLFNGLLDQVCRGMIEVQLIGRALFMGGCRTAQRQSH